MNDINELGVDEQLTRKVRKIAMTSEFEMSEQSQSRTTRRTVVATGAKLAYAAPLVAASLKVSTLGAFAAVTGAVICTHSLEDPGFAGCKPACTSTGLSGDVCEDLCRVGCPVGQGNENPCCSSAFCDPASFDPIAGTGPSCP